jgi:phage terminase large subunit-like protein
VCILGGNRSSKTNYPANRLVKQMIRQPGSRFWCLHTTEATSIRDQQPVVYNYLPMEFKGKKRTERVAALNYTQKNGFADNTFVLPNGSQCWFMNFKQDRDVIEGGEVDGIWVDELVPVDWLITIRSRYVTRNGWLIVTFTPVRGYTEVVGEYLTGSETVQWIESDLLPNRVNWPKGKPGQVPYVMKCLHPKHAVIFFQSRFNLFSNYEALKSTFHNKSSEYILERAHGVPLRRAGNLFPKFGPHNIVPKAKIPAEGTNYHFIDFAWSRNWAQFWIRVTEVSGKKRYYVYRDWPDAKTFGEWVVNSSKPDGERGPAQTPMGYGIRQYKEVIWASEGHRKTESSGAHEKAELIFLRYGDPRSGKAAAMVEEEGGTCIIDLMAQEQGDVAPMEVLPARALLITEGVNLINELLDYNEDLPIDAMNEPALYISEDCQQVIDCLRIWTGAAGEKGASKDFIDLLRYAVTEDLNHVSTEEMAVHGGGTY